MLVFEKVSEIEAHLNEKPNNESLGFVPTMGALHDGHISLIREAKQQCKTVICSIFVNPGQFNDKSDLDRYPRTPVSDKALLSSSGCDILFIPSEKEVYPGDPQAPDVNIGNLETTMEGQFRPGHFKGVMTVVNRLFEIIKPQKAFFGKKDFQQLAIIKKMAFLKNLPIEIVGCPIMREKNGLAMSSRNELLSKEERREAGNIHLILSQAASFSGKYSVIELKEWVIDQFKNQEHIKLEYFEIVGQDDLQPVMDLSKGSVIGCFAGYIGKVRLIDNIEIMVSHKS